MSFLIIILLFYSVVLYFGIARTVSLPETIVMLIDAAEFFVLPNKSYIRKFLSFEEMLKLPYCAILMALMLSKVV